MPLSEHEKKLLAEMEEALAADDPRLISAFNGQSPSRLRVIAGFGLFLLGIAALFAGMISQTPAIGLLGFIVALAGIVLAISHLSALMKMGIPRISSGAPKKKWGPSFEERWDQRRNSDDH
jgi:hypothetical protein